MITYIKNGRVILNDRIADTATIEINNGRISAVGRWPQFKKRLLRPPRFARGSRNDEIKIIDAKGCFVSPGFIDCHIHGEPEKIFFNEARHGMTAFVAAESCAPLNYIYERVKNLKEFIKTHPSGPNLLGLRLEGPYISKAKAGAQSTAYIRRPDAKELSSVIGKCAGLLKIMTIAPELKDAISLIRLLHRHKIIASVGHSDATYESAVEGIDAGITHCTHTFNAMSGIDRREPGVVGAVLMDDRVVAEVILDLIHVHRALFGLLVRLKNQDRIILVTDSLTALDCFGPSGLAMTKGARGKGSAFDKASADRQGSPRAYWPVGPEARSIEMTGGAYRFEDGRLAGSSLTMIGALKNAVKSVNLPLREALKMITLNPAKLLKIEGRKGSIAAGKDADITVFDEEFDVKMTMIRGRIAYRECDF